MNAPKFTLEYFQTTPPEEMVNDATRLLRDILALSEGDCQIDKKGFCIAHQWSDKEPVPPCPFGDAKAFVEQHDYFAANY